MYHFPVPDLHLPMDSIINGSMQGTIPESVKGAATLMPGPNGNGLHISDTTAYIDYGYHSDNCFANPIKCTNGITISMWLRLPSIPDDGAIIDTGSLRFTYGYYIGIRKVGKLFITIKDDRDYQILCDRPIGAWQMVTYNYDIYDIWRHPIISQWLWCRCQGSTWVCVWWTSSQRIFQVLPFLDWPSGMGWQNCRETDSWWVCCLASKTLWLPDLGILYKRPAAVICDTNYVLSWDSSD